jgi:hypothetical protein
MLIFCSFLPFRIAQYPLHSSSRIFGSEFIDLYDSVSCFRVQKKKLIIWFSVFSCETFTNTGEEKKALGSFIIFPLFYNLKTSESI